MADSIGTDGPAQPSFITRFFTFIKQVKLLISSLNRAIVMGVSQMFAVQYMSTLCLLANM